MDKLYGYLFHVEAYGYDVKYRKKGFKDITPENLLCLYRLYDSLQRGLPMVVLSKRVMEVCEFCGIPLEEDGIGWRALPNV